MAPIDPCSHDVRPTMGAAPGTVLARSHSFALTATPAGIDERNRALAVVRDTAGAVSLVVCRRTGPAGHTVEVAVRIGPEQEAAWAVLAAIFGSLD